MAKIVPLVQPTFSSSRWSSLLSLSGILDSCDDPTATVTGLRVKWDADHTVSAGNLSTKTILVVAGLVRINLGIQRARCRTIRKRDRYATKARRFTPLPVQTRGEVFPEAGVYTSPWGLVSKYDSNWPIAAAPAGLTWLFWGGLDCIPSTRREVE